MPASKQRAAELAMGRGPARPEPKRPILARADEPGPAAKADRYAEVAFFRGCLFASAISLAGYCVIMFVYYAARALLGQ